MLDGNRSADRPVRPGDGMAGDAQSAAAGGKRARTRRRAGILPEPVARGELRPLRSPATLSDDDA